MKINARFPEWAADSLALACVFTWILVYPLHGFHTRNILKKAGATNRKELSAVDWQEKY
jgi:hypothetical protein